MSIKVEYFFLLSIPHVRWVHGSLMVICRAKISYDNSTILVSYEIAFANTIEYEWTYF